ncbi:hypothetical protein GOBAR_AA20255 [Gossypium barbadense]|uniref:Uncharacterized protein n=1 Tax=Gossypium barbadense TaxID=3634 RepID=A0A2P5XAN8_GOSBA|nr:hypothetical protein GOBAR_AA20255 [Gossypium barbadense]
MAERYGRVSSPCRRNRIEPCPWHACGFPFPHSWSLMEFIHVHVARLWGCIASRVLEKSCTLFLHGRIAQPCLVPCLATALGTPVADENPEDFVAFGSLDHPRRNLDGSSNLHYKYYCRGYFEI